MVELVNQPMQTSATTRNRLVEAAADKFWRQGFHCTSLAAILAEAETHGGSLYYFFPSKESLLLAVLDCHAERLGEQIFAPALRRSNEPVEQIFHVLALYREFLEVSACSMGCPIGNLALELSDTLPAVRERVARIFDQWTDRILCILEDARDALPEGVSLQSLSRFVLTVMEGGVMQAKTQRSLEPFDDSVAHLRRYFDALLAENPRGPQAAGGPPSKEA